MWALRHPARDFGLASALNWIHSLRQVLRIRFLIPALLLALIAPNLPAADEGQLDGSPAIFTVLAAINAAGYDADLNSPATHPLRMAVRQHLASKQIPVLKQIREFVAEH